MSDGFSIEITSATPITSPTHVVAHASADEYGRAHPVKETTAPEQQGKDVQGAGIPEGGAGEGEGVVPVVFRDEGLQQLHEELCAEVLGNDRAQLPDNNGNSDPQPPDNNDPQPPDSDQCCTPGEKERRRVVMEDPPTPDEGSRSTRRGRCSRKLTLDGRGLVKSPSENDGEGTPGPRSVLSPTTVSSDGDDSSCAQFTDFWGTCKQLALHPDVNDRFRKAFAKDDFSTSFHDEHCLSVFGSSDAASPARMRSQSYPGIPAQLPLAVEEAGGVKKALKVLETCDVHTVVSYMTTNAADRECVLGGARILRQRCREEDGVRSISIIRRSLQRLLVNGYSQDAEVVECLLVVLTHSVGVDGIHSQSAPNFMHLLPSWLVSDKPSVQLAATGLVLQFALLGHYHHARHVTTALIDSVSRYIRAPVAACREAVIVALSALESYFVDEDLVQALGRSELEKLLDVDPARVVKDMLLWKHYTSVVKLLVVDDRLELALGEPFALVIKGIISHLPKAVERAARHRDVLLCAVGGAVALAAGQCGDRGGDLPFGGDDTCEPFSPLAATMARPPTVSPIQAVVQTLDIALQAACPLLANQKYMQMILDTISQCGRVFADQDPAYNVITEVAGMVVYELLPATHDMVREEMIRVCVEGMGREMQLIKCLVHYAAECGGGWDSVYHAMPDVVCNLARQIADLCLANVTSTGTSPAQLQAVCAQALATMAPIPSARHLFLEPDTVECLVYAIKMSHISAVRKACITVFCCVCASGLTPAEADVLAEKGVVGAILLLLQGNESVPTSLETLTHLCHHPTPRRQVYQADGLSLLLDLVRLGTSAVQKIALVALGCVCEDEVICAKGSDPSVGASTISDAVFRALYVATDQEVKAAAGFALAVLSLSGADELAVDGVVEAIRQTINLPSYSPVSALMSQRHRKLCAEQLVCIEDEMSRGKNVDIIDALQKEATTLRTELQAKEEACRSMAETLGKTVSTRDEEMAKLVQIETDYGLLCRALEEAIDSTSALEYVLPMANAPRKVKTALLSQPLVAAALVVVACPTVALLPPPSPATPPRSPHPHATLASTVRASLEASTVRVAALEIKIEEQQRVIRRLEGELEERAAELEEKAKAVKESAAQLKEKEEEFEKSKSALAHSGTRRVDLVQNEKTKLEKKLRQVEAQLEQSSRSEEALRAHIRTLEQRMKEVESRAQVRCHATDSLRERLNTALDLVSERNNEIAVLQNELERERARVALSRRTAVMHPSPPPSPSQPEIRAAVNPRPPPRPDPAPHPPVEPIKNFDAAINAPQADGMPSSSRSARRVLTFPSVQETIRTRRLHREVGRLALQLDTLRLLKDDAVQCAVESEAKAQVEKKLLDLVRQCPLGVSGHPSPTNAAALLKELQPWWDEVRVAWAVRYELHLSERFDVLKKCVESLKKKSPGNAHQQEGDDAHPFFTDPSHFDSLHKVKVPKHRSRKAPSKSPYSVASS